MFGDERQSRLKHVEPFIELLIRNHQRYQNAHHVPVRPRCDSDQAVFVGVTRKLFRLRTGRFARLPIADQFDRAHAAEAAHVADQGKLLLPGPGALFEALSDSRGSRKQSVFLNRFKRSQRRHARSWISCKGAAQPAGNRRVHNFRSAGDGGNRQSAAQ